MRSRDVGDHDSIGWLDVRLTLVLMQVLETTTVRQSHKHPTLVTITVDGFQSNPEPNKAPTRNTEHDWRLPNSDPRSEGRFLFRLHTLDIYFWTAQDANSFISIVRELLQPQQLDILDAPLAAAVSEGLVSPVVRNLESIAVDDPTLHKTQTKEHNFAAPDAPHSPHAIGNDKAPKAEEVAYKPLAYNPASPPAPEQFAHREKTPPPIESEGGTGLTAAAYHDQNTTSAAPFSQRQGSLVSPAPTYPQGSLGLGNNSHAYQPAYGSPPLPASYAGAPSPPHEHRTSITSSFSHATMVATPNPYTGVPSFSPPPTHAASPSASYNKQTNSAFGLPRRDSSASIYKPDSQEPETPTAEVLGHSYISSPQQPLQHLQPQYPDYLESRRQSQPPEGGYSNYQYDQPHHHHKHHSHANDYNVHNQAYRPTESEAHKHKHRKASESDAGQQSGKLEQKAEKVEKGINRFLRKVEKRIG